MLDVKIEEPSLCSVYSARIVENVRVKPSPRWMRERLRAMGVRPINNIVDITNYVMLEYGQPMHAFDLRFIEDKKIRVRRAKDGETITTLDGVDRTLTHENLVIADSKKPVAIAGVMGGEHSGITEGTHTVVFESACFKGSSVRVTAKKLGMRTESSGRFEKGLDAQNCLPAIQRACELVELLGAGEVVDGVIDIDNTGYQPTVLHLDAEWINRFLGTDISEERMKQILTDLHFGVNGNEITVPSFRADVEHKADIAEEIARIYGYNNIPTTTAKGSPQGKYSEYQKFEQKINQTMLAQGLYEIMTYSFLSPKAYDKIGMPEQDYLRNSVTISNPLGEDTSIMRTTALPSMLDTLARNYNNRNGAVALFELASEYYPVEELPDEKTKLIAGLYGDDCDFFTAKGMVEQLLDTLFISNYEFEASSNEYAYHPGRCAHIMIDDTVIGVIGEIHPKVAENYGINERILCFTLDVDSLFTHTRTNATYTPLPKFPAVTRDLALICDEAIPVRILEKAITKGAGNLLETIQLFDVYQGEQIENGKKSVAFNIVLRSAENTLAEEQVNSTMKKVMKELEKVGASLRV